MKCQCLLSSKQSKQSNVQTISKVFFFFTLFMFFFIWNNLRTQIPLKEAMANFKPHINTSQNVSIYYYL